MEELNIYYQILLSFVFGAILGLETEIRDVGEKEFEKVRSQKIGGVRTYATISIFGSLCGILYANEIYIGLGLGFLTLTLLITVAYAMNIFYKKAFGITTEIVIAITFLLGFFLTANIIPLTILLFILIIITFFLSQKRGLAALLTNFNQREFIDIIKFALLVLVIFPLLPNQVFTLEDIFSAIQGLNYSGLSEEVLQISVINPSRVWLLVTIITGINLVGYLLNKFIGNKRGLFVTSFLGGLVSSTSTTISLAQNTKHKSDLNYQVSTAGAAIVSTGSSFFTSLILLTALNRDLLFESYLLFLTMSFVGIGVGSYLLFKHSKDLSFEKLEVSSERFALLPALQFVLIIVGVTVVIQLLELFSNDALIVLGTSISGLTGLDASLIATSELLSEGTVTLFLGLIIVVVTNAINLCAKIVYGFIFGGKEFAKVLTIGMLAIGISSLIGLL